jgi:large subunit ribosomal protein L6
MSRIGKKPIPIPGSAKLNYEDRLLEVKGEKGTLQQKIHPLVDLSINGNEINVVIEKDDRESNAMRGLMRSLVANMVTGVTEGFQRTLEINGIGYRVESRGDSLLFNLGYSKPIDYKLPEGISATVEKNTLRLFGIDKELLGQTAAYIRQLRPPECYKGKGIKYAEERIQRKAGKAGGK